MVEKVSLFLKGFGIGAANIIPGVSGGTIALITGIYERLIAALNNFDFQAVKLFFKFKFKKLYPPSKEGGFRFVELNITSLQYKTIYNKFVSNHEVT